MKRGFVLAAVIALLILPSVFALSVTTSDEGSVIIKELGNPAMFKFNITSGGADNIGILTYVGFSPSPRGNFDIASGLNSVDVKFYPSQDLLNNNGYYTFQYQVVSQQAGITSGNLMVKFVSLSDAVKISVDPVAPGDTSATVHVQNTQDAYLENLALDYSSAFFKGSQALSLNPFEEKSFNISIDQAASKGLRAGQYVVTGTLNMQGAQVSVSGNFEYLEQENVATSTLSEGIIIHHTTITKTNTGNTDASTSIAISKDAFSRLFTSFSSDPLSSQRSGFVISYDWQKPLAPGESYSVTATTNYTFPFVIILLAAIIIVLVKMQQRTSMVVRKNVSFVKTKGGEFALKVTLHARAVKNVENAQLVDSIPQSLKLFESFGKKPDRIDAATRRMFWNLGDLGAGEERVFSYIVYSKIRVVGRFELPSALAVFGKGEKTEEVFSNRAFFISEIAGSE